ncbi:hypothetical protein LTR36_005819 [Oleoguttula mirabilis]|uniref:Uncharacterized protein n=1 Tax=Oleoguttula mirabilis TaxID=1507867 RepID=A0AAV9JE04_9PEZI|nr:hypothetical protein LTR36_005819 [Oleoguttula mirabilis]
MPGEKCPLPDCTVPLTRNSARRTEVITHLRNIHGVDLVQGYGGNEAAKRAKHGEQFLEWLSEHGYDASLAEFFTNVRDGLVGRSGGTTPGGGAGARLPARGRRPIQQQRPPPAGYDAGSASETDSSGYASSSSGGSTSSSASADPDTTPTSNPRHRGARDGGERPDRPPTIWPHPPMCNAHRPPPKVDRQLRCAFCAEEGGRDGAVTYPTRKQLWQHYNAQHGDFAAREPDREEQAAVGPPPPPPHASAVVVSSASSSAAQHTGGSLRAEKPPASTSRTAGSKSLANTSARPARILYEYQGSPDGSRRFRQLNQTKCVFCSDRLWPDGGDGATSAAQRIKAYTSLAELMSHYADHHSRYTLRIRQQEESSEGEVERGGKEEEEEGVVRIAIREKAGWTSEGGDGVNGRE